MLYVLNSGGLQPNITSFTVGSDGTLTNVAAATRTVDPGSCTGCGGLPPLFVVSPGQIGVSPDGTTLVLTVKGTDLIETFALDGSGIPSAAPVTTPSHGSTPFGFTFDGNGHLLVAEAFGNSHRPPGNAASAGAVSSYTLDSNGGADVITASLENQQTTPCWIATSGDRSVAYVADNGSSTLSAYRIADDGSLTFMPGSWPCSRPDDLAMTTDGAFLYTNDAGTGTVSGFSVNADGTLTLLDQIAGLPVYDGAVGTAVR
jgi:6-phosphogluconolactonase (cycloisomerase 2 family)